MPYKDPERQREYARNWVAGRRAEWFHDKVCFKCGSNENLQLDHEDPKKKIDHRIWSWSLQRREAELTKCRPLCGPCHAEKSRTEQPKGTERPNAKVNEEIVRAIRASSESYRTLAKQYGLAHPVVRRIKLGVTWKHVI